MSAHLRLASAPDSAESAAETRAPITVVLGDSHAGLRRSLKRLLDREDDVEVVAEAPDLSTVVRHVHARHPRVLVLALRLPDGSSIDTIRLLRTQASATEIVVMTMEEIPRVAQQAIDAGAIGFVLTDNAESELPAALRCATRGEEYVSPRVAAGLDALRRAAGDGGLSPRETEILRLIALGHTSAEIAAMLQISRRTVETHRARIHRKLGLRTRAQLVGFALGRHLIA